MSDQTINRRFLHRCCIQFSSLCAETEAVEAEKQHALRFTHAHAARYPRELARALVWRVVETDEDDLPGRTGAWAVLNAVLCACGASGDALSHTPLAECLSAFLPYLIEHRWYTQQSRHDDLPAAASGEGNVAVAPQSSRREAQLASYRGNVLPLSFLDGSSRGGGSSIEQHRRAQQLTAFYHGILASWKTLWRADVYQKLREVVKGVERNGNFLSAEASTFLDVPRTFKDSLWKLRRKDPRPIMAYQVLYYYSSSERLAAVEEEASADKDALSDDMDRISDVSQQAEREEAALAAYSRGGNPVTLPSSVVEVEKLDPAMHPAIKVWLRKLVATEGGCRWCDTWHHVEHRCPCERPFRRSPSDALMATKKGELSPAALQQSVRQHCGLTTSMTYMQAVDVLHAHGVALPLKFDVALDVITNLIRDQKPFDEVLAAFDLVREAVTGPMERHALWVHANYAVRPSQMVFEKPNDNTHSPAMAKAESFLLAHRRYNECETLRHAVEVLDRAMRRREVPTASRRHIREIRHVESFFFCLVDGSLPSVFTPGQYARDPEAVVAVASLKDITCHYCLEPFHDEAHCTRSKKKEPWDLRVARTVLADNHLLDLKLPGEEYRVENAYRMIDEDDRKAKEFRKKELDLAIKLVPMRGISICTRCLVVGHDLRQCSARVEEVLKLEGIQAVDVRLDPAKYIFKRLRSYRESGDDVRRSDLNDAYRTLLRLGQTPFPTSFKEAIDELASVSIPLAAARYSNVAVSTFLFSVGSSDLLQHLAPLRDVAFPHVCLYCDSYHHRSEDCSEATDEESRWLRELHRCGVDLYQYIMNPAYYEARLPLIDLARGRERVLEQIDAFAKDYAVGGIGRERFLKETGLDVASNATQISAYGLMTARSSSSAVNATPGQSQQLGGRPQTLYGGCFSQLVAVRDGDANVEEEEAHKAAHAPVHASTSPLGGSITITPAAFFETTPTAALTDGTHSESAFLSGLTDGHHESTAVAPDTTNDSLPEVWHEEKETSEPRSKKSRTESETHEEDGASTTSPDAVQ